MSDAEVTYEERDGRRVAIVPADLFDRMLDDLDDLDDIRAYDRAKRAPLDYIPAAMADRLIARENPIKLWREHRALTASALAQQLGISRPYLSQLEAGKRQASLAVLRRLAAALGVDIDDLVPADRNVPSV
jgi:DNA-binding XRE family transcriptional regulator